MKITKFNRGRTGFTIGSVSSIQHNESTRTPEGSQSSGDSDAYLWGNHFDGTDDIDQTLFVNGSLYAMPDMFNEEDDEEDNLPEGELPEKKEKEYEAFEDDNGGNIYAQNLIKSMDRIEAGNEAYSPELYLNYPDKKGTKTNILDLFKFIMPTGSIIMYSGKETKANLNKMGWAICDGSTQEGVTTPDLKDKFIKGCVSTSDIGGTGGQSSVTLTVDNMPSHSHTATTTISSSFDATGQTNDSDWKKKYVPAKSLEWEEEVFDLGGSRHFLPQTKYKEGENSGLESIQISDIISSAMGGTVTSTATTTIGNTGSGTEFNVEPPYYSLIYIMRIA